MPFASKRQARYLAARHPKIFKKFVKEGGGKVVVKSKKKKGY